MGSTKNVDMSMTETEVKVVEELETEEQDNEATTAPKQSRGRSSKYQAVRAQVDKTRQYDSYSAIELVKRLSYSNFPGTITAHVVLKEKEQGAQVSLKFPHTTGKTIRVEVANETTLKNIEAGEINFDILLARPDMMSKLAKFAPILGPQGLMPNPKQGTLSENPEERKAELESGQLTLRTERKAPLMHIVIGTTEMDTKELQENLETLIDALGTKVVKITLAATMSPGVKVAIERE